MDININVNFSADGQRCLTSCAKRKINLHRVSIYYIIYNRLVPINYWCFVLHNNHQLIMSNIEIKKDVCFSTNVGFVFLARPFLISGGYDTGIAQKETNKKLRRNRKQYTKKCMSSHILRDEYNIPNTRLRGYRIRFLIWVMLK